MYYNKPSMSRFKPKFKPIPPRVHIGMTDFDEDKINHLMTLAQSGEVSSIMSYLRESGLPGNVSKPDTGDTVLHFVLESPNIARDEKQHLVRLLVAEGADVNGANNEGITPLMIATKNQSKTLVNTLIGFGAYLPATDVMGRTALHYAILGKSSTCEPSRRERSLVKQGVEPPPDSSIALVEQEAADLLDAVLISANGLQMMDNISNAIGNMNRILPERVQQIRDEHIASVNEVAISGAIDAGARMALTDVNKRTRENIRKFMEGELDKSLKPMTTTAPNEKNWGPDNFEVIEFPPSGNQLAREVRESFTKMNNDATNLLGTSLNAIADLAGQFQLEFDRSQEQLAGVFRDNHRINYLGSYVRGGGVIPVPAESYRSRGFDNAGIIGLVLDFEGTLSTSVLLDQPENNLAAAPWDLAFDERETMVRLTDKELKKIDRRDVRPLRPSSFVVVKYYRDGRVPTADFVKLTGMDNDAIEDIMRSRDLVVDRDDPFHAALVAAPGVPARAGEDFMHILDDVRFVDAYGPADEPNIIVDTTDNSLTIDGAGLRPNFTILGRIGSYITELNGIVSAFRGILGDMTELPIAVLNGIQLVMAIKGEADRTTQMINQLDAGFQRRRKDEGDNGPAAWLFDHALGRIASIRKSIGTNVIQKLDTAYSHLLDLWRGCNMKLKAFNQVYMGELTRVAHPGSDVNDWMGYPDNHLRPLAELPGSLMEYLDLRNGTGSHSEWVLKMLENWVPTRDNNTMVSFARAVNVDPLPGFAVSAGSANLDGLVPMGQRPRVTAELDDARGWKAENGSFDLAPLTTAAGYNDFINTVVRVLGEHVDNFVLNQRSVLIGYAINAFNAPLIARLTPAFDMYPDDSQELVISSILLRAFDRALVRRIAEIAEKHATLLAREVFAGGDVDVDIDFDIGIANVRVPIKALEVRLDDVNPGLVRRLNKNMGSWFESDFILGSREKQSLIYTEPNTDYSTKGPIEDECYKLDLALMRDLLSRIDVPVNQRDTRGGTALHVAISRQHVGVVTMLLDHSAHVTDKFVDRRLVDEQDPLEHALELYNANNRLICSNNAEFFRLFYEPFNGDIKKMIKSNRSKGYKIPVQSMILLPMILIMYNEGFYRYSLMDGNWIDDLITESERAGIVDGSEWHEIPLIGEYMGAGVVNPDEMASKLEAMGLRRQRRSKRRGQIRRRVTQYADADEDGALSGNLPPHELYAQIEQEIYLPSRGRDSRGPGMGTRVEAELPEYTYPEYYHLTWARLVKNIGNKKNMRFFHPTLTKLEMMQIEAARFASNPDQLRNCVRVLKMIQKAYQNILMPSAQKYRELPPYLDNDTDGYINDVYYTSLYAVNSVLSLNFYFAIIKTVHEFLLRSSNASEAQSKISKLMNENHDTAAASDPKLLNYIRNEMTPVIVRRLMKIYKNEYEEDNMSSMPTIQTMMERVIEIVVDNPHLGLSSDSDSVLVKGLKEDLIPFYRDIYEKFIPLIKAMMDNYHRFIINDYRQLQIVILLMDKAIA